jgi:hypothetical protein
MERRWYLVVWRNVAHRATGIFVARSLTDAEPYLDAELLGRL